MSACTIRRLGRLKIGKIGMCVHLLGAPLLWALPFEVSLTPPQTELGEGAQLQITTEGTWDEPLQLPEVPGLQIHQGGTSSQMSWIQGKVSRQQSVLFQIIPERTGSFIIPGLTLHINGQTYTTAPLTLQVHDASSSWQGGGGVGGGGRVGKAPTADTEGEPTEAVDVTESDQPMVFVKRTFKKSTPYVYEPIVVEHKLYHRVGVSEVREDLTLAGHIRKLDLDQEESQEVVQGVAYDVLTVRKVLIPTKAGTTVLAPYRLSMGVHEPRRSGRRSDLDLFAQFFGGGGRVHPKTLTTQEDTWQVKPLPTQNQPAEFSGLVGTFTTTAEVQPKTLPMGETTTVTVNIQGVGLLETLSKLPWTLPPHQAKVYDDKPEVTEQVHPQYGVLSRRVFKFAVVPKHPGVLPLGTLTLWAFDPTLGRYVDLSVDLGHIEVSPSASAPGTTIPPGSTPPIMTGQDSPSVPMPPSSLSLPPPRPASVLGEDLMDIHRLAGTPSQVLSPPMVYIGLLYASLWPICEALWWSWWCWRQRRRHGSRYPTEILRKKQARKHFRAGLARAKAQTDYGPSALARLFRNYWGDHLGCQVNALTTKDLEQRLVDGGFTPEQVSQVCGCLDQLDQAVFSTQTVHTRADLEQRVIQCLV